jgi:hypothetical protein
MSTVSPWSSSTDVAKHVYGSHHVGPSPKADVASPVHSLVLAEAPAEEEVAAVRDLISRAGSAGGWFEASGAQGTRVSILAEGGASCLGTAIVTRAEESSFRVLAGLSDADLSKAITISDVVVDPARADEVLPALLYLALRRGRIWQRATVVAYVEPTARGAQILQLDRLARLPASGERVAVGQRLDIAIYYAYQAASKDVQAALQRHFVPEAVETLDRWLEVFFDSPWFRAVREGTLTREQYVCTLANLHQFVRHTTRIIGRAIGFSDDRALRNHFLNHLEGEINHELIIEKDLEGLGADVGYVVNAMVPSVANQGFMVTQESMIAFYSDPIMLMAAPFVAEGYTGHLGAKFMNDLEQCARSWGIEHPKRVTRFFASHIEYDGGNENHDGHWEHIRKILDRYLVDDTKLQRFLNVLHLSKNATGQSYDGYVTDLAIFSAVPGTPAA